MPNLGSPHDIFFCQIATMGSDLTRILGAGCKDSGGLVRGFQGESHKASTKEEA